MRTPRPRPRTRRNPPENRFELEATVALDAIRASARDRTELALRSGQLALLLAAVRLGRVPMDQLFWAAVDRMVTETELREQIIRPLQRDGFVRLVKKGPTEYVYVTVGAARHPDPIGAWMAHRSMDDKRAVVLLSREKLKPGDVVFRAPTGGYRGEVSFVNVPLDRLYLRGGDANGEWMPEGIGYYLVARKR